MPSDQTVLILEDDLFFGSRVRAALAGLKVRSVFRLDALPEVVRREHPRAIILNLSGGAPEKLEMVRTLRAAGAARIIGVAGHKERAVRSRALEAGCHTILPHSAVPVRLRQLVNQAAPA